MPRASTMAFLSEGARLVLRQPGAFLATQGIPLLVAGLLPVAVYLLTGSAPHPLPGSRPPAERLPFWASLGLDLAQTALAFVGLGLGIVAADAASRNERVGLAQGWRKMAPRLPNLLGTATMMTGFLLFILLIFGILPIVGTILGLVIVALFRGAWALAEPASVLERLAIGKNFDVSTKRTDRCVAPLALAGVFIALVFALPLWVDLVLELAPAVAPSTAAWMLLAAGLLSTLTGGFLWSATAIAAYHRLTPSADEEASPPASATDAPPIP